ncbi:MAG: dockerin type I repeat-containing protein [Nanoarchaeota archaeon]
MKKGVLIDLLLVLLGLAILGIIGLNLTGYVSWDPDFEGIFRAVPIKNTETNTTDVYMRIASTENVIAIQEFFSSPECNILDYTLNKDIDIFEFNENENIWIFANNSITLDVELFYQIPYECNVSSGKYYTISSFSENNWCNGADTNKDGIVNAADYMAIKRNMGKTCSSPTWCNGADTNKDGKVDTTDSGILSSEFGKSNCSNSSDSNIQFYEYEEPDEGIFDISSTSSSLSSGSSSSSATTKVSTNEIIQVNTNEEYQAQSLSATENLASIQEDFQTTDKYSDYLIIILAIISLLIIGFIIFSMIKRPKGSG